MRLAPAAQNPADLTYRALRKIVGWVALALPFAVVIPWGIYRHVIETSISAYYYTGMRTLFTGSLCAIATFMLCTRGYDRKDELADIFSGICAIGVAFFPTAPAGGASDHQRHVGWVHYSFAALLFLTLAYFCLFLFTMSAQGRVITSRKLQRNRVYISCGVVILVSLVLLPIFTLVLNKPYGGIVFETTSLCAFGAAWLVKGETILKD
jgi:hypothetical protein